MPAFDGPHGLGGARECRFRHVGGVRIADRFVLDRAQAETLRRVIGRLLESAIVEHERFGLLVFQEQFAVVGAVEPARQRLADRVAVEPGAVDQRGEGGVHGILRLTIT